jgi:16S rRNA processing protein RimM
MTRNERVKTEKGKRTEAAWTRAEALIPLLADTPATDRVTLGTLVKPWGKRGEQTVTLYNPASDLLEQVDAVFVSGDGFTLRRVGLRGARRVGKRYVVHLDGIDGIDQAESLRGLELSVPLEWLPPIEDEDENYVRDLIGMAVTDEDGAPMGTLTDVFPTGGHDVYVVRGDEGESLIPATRDFVLEVDLEHRRMRVRRLEL